MSRKSLIWSGVLAAVLLGWRSDDATAQQQVPPVPAGQQQQLPEPEVLDKGPIHEAFAELMAVDPQQLEVITKQPPQPVQEMPPEQQPEGQNVQWISGYWMWDQGRTDFVWVSGMWRDIPPGRKWVPGEWQQVDGGFQWIAGFWADAKQNQIQLLPEPPASLEAGPSSPAPGDNYLWAPGNWYMQDGQYVWQPGYWYEANPNWVWVPNHYSYASNGYTFVNGYWDYPPYQRGLLYAPVYWGSGYGSGYGYYRPRSIINTALLIANLAVNSGHGHYYYGNWGGNYPGWLQPWGYNYGQWGYRQGNHYGYDPLWSYFRWNNRGHWDNDHWNDRDRWDDRWGDRDDWNRWSWDGRGRDWDGRPGDRDGDWDGRPGDRDGRPGDRDGRPGDIADDIAGGGRNRDRGNLITSVDDLTRGGDGSIRTRQLSETDLNQIRDRAQNLNRRGRDIISDTNVGAAPAIDNATRGRGRGQVRVGADGQVLQGNQGGRNRGQLGVDGNAQVGDAVQGRVGADGQVLQGNPLQGNQGGRNRGRGQFGVDGNAQVGDPVQGGVGADVQNQFRRGQGRAPVPGVDSNTRLNAQGNIDRRIDGQPGQVQGSVNELLRGRVNQQGTNLDGRAYSRGQQGIQYGDRTRGQIPGNAQRNLQGPVQQRVMRLPSGQQVIPQGQNYGTRIEGGPPAGNFNRGGQGQRSFNIPQQGGGGRGFNIPQGGGGGQRAIQQAPQNIQRSLPGVGGGGGGSGRSFQGGGGGRGGGDAFRGGGGGGGGRGNAGGGGGQGGGGGGGRGRGDRD